VKAKSKDQRKGCRRNTQHQLYDIATSRMQALTVSKWRRVDPKSIISGCGEIGL